MSSARKNGIVVSVHVGEGKSRGEGEGEGECWGESKGRSENKSESEDLCWGARKGEERGGKERGVSATYTAQRHIDLSGWVLDGVRLVSYHHIGARPHQIPCREGGREGGRDEMTGRNTGGKEGRRR